MAGPRAGPACDGCHPACERDRAGNGAGGGSDARAFDPATLCRRLPRGLCGAFFGVAQVSFMPTLLGRDRLVGANARYQTSRTKASLIGPRLPRAAVPLLTGPVAVVLDASSVPGGGATRLLVPASA